MNCHDAVHATGEFVRPNLICDGNCGRKDCGTARLFVVEFSERVLSVVGLCFQLV